jgi:molecular chaperone GrpE (heat shock protein)
MAAAFPPPTPRWPFFLGDAVLVIFALILFYTNRTAAGCSVLIASTLCMALGALLGVLPFLMDDRAARRQEEAAGLASTVNQIQNLEVVASRIADATAQWQSIHDHATQAAKAARATAEAMSTEMKSFMEFFEKANDAERQHLRLEVEKLKRDESDWVNVLVRIMDHVFAIHAAGSRSGQRNVIHQLTQFQNACRDAARRVGLVPVEVEPGTPFDSAQHQLPAGVNPPPAARIAGTLATGYTLRGERIRPALVQLEGHDPDPIAAPPTDPGGSAQPESSGPDQELPL